MNQDDMRRASTELHLARVRAEWEAVVAAWPWPTRFLLRLLSRLMRS